MKKIIWKGGVVVLALFIVTPGLVRGANQASDADLIRQLQIRATVLEMQLAAAQTIATPQTSGLVLGESAIAFTRPLRKGVSGPDVSQLQTRLAEMPDIYPEGTVTGYFGNLTELAVQRYQAKEGIVSSGSPSTTGYGQVGRLTFARIMTNETAVTESPSPAVPTPAPTPTPAPIPTVVPPAITPPVVPPPTTSCLPRPACLDGNPRCLIAEPAGGWCAPITPPPVATTTPTPVPTPPPPVATTTPPVVPPMPAINPTLLQPFSNEMLAHDPVPAGANPAPFTVGKEVYGISSAASGPKLTEASFDPVDAQPGQQQIVSVKANDKNPIDNLIITYRTDNRLTSYELKLVEGTRMDGRWAGIIQIYDSHTYAYQVMLTARTWSGESKVTLTIR